MNDVQPNPWPAEPFTEEKDSREWAGGVDPLEFFGRTGGLMSMKMGMAVAVMGPLARGIDGQVWRYSHGVYLPDGPGQDIIRDRTASLLKDSYRPSHAAIARDVVLGAIPALTSEPVENLINLPNGLLDWRTGRWMFHSPEVLSTVQLATTWDPSATCPMFDAWLAEVVPEDCIELAWELIGYLAYSGNPLHTAVMLTGSGRNGKGTFLRVIKSVLGESNITSVSLHDLLNTRFRTATLFGKIANIAGDIDSTHLENTAVLKAITGQDQIQAERKGRDPFDFTPWSVPVFSANKIPSSADTTTGYLSRWLVIPFPHSFEGKEDRKIGARLATELPGILAGGLRRLQPLLERGQFSCGWSAASAKAEFSRKVDQVRSWLWESCTASEGGPGDPGISRSVMYQAYKRGVQRDGGKPVKAQEFYDRVQAAGAEPFTLHGQRCFRGVKIVDQGYEIQPSYAGYR